MNEGDALAFIKALTYKEVVEVAAVASSLGNVIELCYNSYLQWPWPREFKYQLEYFAVAEASEVASVINLEHEIVVNLFHQDLVSQAGILHKLGLTRAWDSPLMGRDLAQPWLRPVPSNVSAREVTSSKDRNRFNAISGISNQSGAIDDYIHYFFFENDAQVIAKGQLIYLGEGTAYIADLFTDHPFRRQGWCSAMIAVLEEKARSLGATRAVLAPGLEQIELQLYERYGYSRTAERTLLIFSGQRDDAD
ncbi:MAG: GNAT family N-acetyltransferase [Cyanobacteria bacterium P01_C01_bin.89]